MLPAALVFADSKILATANAQQQQPLAYAAAVLQV